MFAEGKLRVLAGDAQQTLRDVRHAGKTMGLVRQKRCVSRNFLDASCRCTAYVTDAFKDMKMKKLLATFLFVGSGLAGCAGGGTGGFDSLNFSNAAQVHIFTPEEQNAMTAEGTIPTMLAPSEIREHFEKIKAGKYTKPTGVVTYCDAGLAQLIQSRRNQALAAIDAACGGKDQYEIRREGLGNLKTRYAGNVQGGASCTRSREVIFRCNGVQPKLNLSK